MNSHDPTDLVINGRHALLGPDDVWIDRRTIWGNPFVIGPDGNRAEVLRKHREWFANQPELIASLESLRGKRLVCWCKHLECHGDHLIWLLYGHAEIQEWLTT